MNMNLIILPCSFLLVPIERFNGGGGGWIFDADDLVALRIAAGTRPSVYFEDEGDDRSMEPVVIVVDEAASDGGFNWLWCWWWWSFNKRIRHQSGALGSWRWTTRTCCPLLTVNSCELRAV